MNVKIALEFFCNNKKKADCRKYCITQGVFCEYLEAKNNI